MPIPRDEQETVITWLWASDRMTLSTTNPAHCRSMQKLGYEPIRTSRIPVKWRDVENAKTKVVTREPLEWEDTAWTFDLPAEYFKLPRPKKRVGDEQRARLSERMKGAKV